MENERVVGGRAGLSTFVVGAVLLLIFVVFPSDFVRIVPVPAPVAIMILVSVSTFS